MDRTLKLPVNVPVGRKLQQKSPEQVRELILDPAAQHVAPAEQKLAGLLEQKPEVRKRDDKQPERDERVATKQTHAVRHRLQQAHQRIYGENDHEDTAGGVRIDTQTQDRAACERGQTSFLESFGAVEQKPKGQEKKWRGDRPQTRTCVVKQPN